MTDLTKPMTRYRVWLLPVIYIGEFDCDDLGQYTTLEPVDIAQFQDKEDAIRFVDLLVDICKLRGVDR